MQHINISSPAKLNIFLKVLGKRPDGYHELLSLMERISISDEIEIKLAEKGITVTCDNEQVPAGEQNIVYRAVKEILAYYSRNIGVDVHIKKVIPVAAGMGGGSSNAAAVLKGLNQLLKLKLPKEKLMVIGTKIGADVPFFLFDGPAIATGIGDQLRKVKKIPKIPVLVVTPKVPVSTKSVYERLGLKVERPPVPQSPLLKKVMQVPDSFSTKQSVASVMENDLEKVTIGDHPIISEIKELLIAQGALASQMTGSGPSVFAIFPDKVAAEKAFLKVEARSGKEWSVFQAENLSNQS